MSRRNTKKGQIDLKAEAVYAMQSRVSRDNFNVHLVTSVVRDEARPSAFPTRQEPAVNLTSEHFPKLGTPKVSKLPVPAQSSATADLARPINDDQFEQVKEKKAALPVPVATQNTFDTLEVQGTVASPTQVTFSSILQTVRPPKDSSEPPKLTAEVLQELDKRSRITANEEKLAQSLSRIRTEANRAAVERDFEDWSAANGGFITSLYRFVPHSGAEGEADMSYEEFASFLYDTAEKDYSKKFPFGGFGRLII